MERLTHNGPITTTGNCLTIHIHMSITSWMEEENEQNEVCLYNRAPLNGKTEQTTYICDATHRNIMESKRCQMKDDQDISLFLWNILKRQIFRDREQINHFLELVGNLLVKRKILKTVMVVELCRFMPTNPKIAELHESKYTDTFIDDKDLLSSFSHCQLMSNYDRLIC